MAGLRATEGRAEKSYSGHDRSEQPLGRVGTRSTADRTLLEVAYYHPINYGFVHITSVILSTMAELWLLLIYTVPAEPSRKRASVWRALKRLGAIYLRDGVAVLPQRPDTLSQLRAVAAKIEEFEGQATLVEDAQLPSQRAEAIMTQSRAARDAEYAEIVAEAERFLAHVQRETEHREFRSSELTELEVDLGKVKAWLEQVQSRDYFGSEVVDHVQALLSRCDEALAMFLDQTYAQEAVEP